MRWVDRRALTLLALTLSATAGAQDKSTYGKVETFEPGKKYTCVPTPDRKGWDCSQSGKASDKAPPETPPAAPAPRAEASPPPSTIAAPPPPAPPAPSQHASELPGYLSARAASGAAPPPAPEPAQTSPPSTAPAATVKPTQSSAAPTAAPAPSAPTQQAATAPPSARPETAKTAEAASSTTASAPAEAPPPAAAAASTPEKTPEPPVERAPAPTPVAPTAPAATQPAATSASAPAIPAVRLSGGTSAFLALPSEQYVIELAHGASEADLAGVAAPERGEVYKLHLRQNGADVWLLVWGTFPDVAAARAARAEVTQGTPGWPRRIGPLQAEARRAGD